jgi:hypothetical protein
MLAPCTQPWHTDLMTVGGIVPVPTRDEEEELGDGKEAAHKQGLQSPGLWLYLHPSPTPRCPHHLPLSHFPALLMTRYCLLPPSPSLLHMHANQTHSCAHACSQCHAHVHTRSAHTHSHMLTRTHVFTHACLLVHAQSTPHSYTNAHTHTHTHTHTYSCAFTGTHIPWHVPLILRGVSTFTFGPRRPSVRMSLFGHSQSPGDRWLSPVILATHKGEIRRIMI